MNDICMGYLMHRGVEQNTADIQRAKGEKRIGYKGDGPKQSGIVDTAWKKKYNAQYYQEHKDYWKQYYRNKAKNYNKKYGRFDPNPEYAKAPVREFVKSSKGGWNNLKDLGKADALAVDKMDLNRMGWNAEDPESWKLVIDNIKRAKNKAKDPLMKSYYENLIKEAEKDRDTETDILNMRNEWAKGQVAKAKAEAAASVGRGTAGTKVKDTDKARARLKKTAFDPIVGIKAQKTPITHVKKSTFFDKARAWLQNLFK